MKRIKAAAPEDSYRNLWRALEKWPDAYVHFSSIEKVGVNPRKGHNDPHGVYVYPVWWLRDNFNKMGKQYATDYKWAYVLELVEDKRGYVLQDMTEGQVEAIADRNGWREALDIYAGKDELLPGEWLWKVCDELQRRPSLRSRALGVPLYVNEALNKAYPWSKSLAGVSWLEDTGDGIINPGEPCQTLVMDVRLLKVLEKVENRNVGGSEDRKQWRRLMEYYGVKKVGGGRIPLGDGFTLHRVGWNGGDAGVVLYKDWDYKPRRVSPLGITKGDWLAQVQQQVKEVKWVDGVVDGVSIMVEQKAKVLDVGGSLSSSHSVPLYRSVFFYLFDQEYIVRVTPGKVSVEVHGEDGNHDVLKEVGTVEEAVAVVEKFVSEHMSGMKVSGRVLSALLRKDVYRNLWDALGRWPGRYVHFSQIDKVGINTQISDKTGNKKVGHSDPKGVYAYPVDWLVENFSKVGSQFATDYAYAFVLDVNKGGEGYVLGDMTREDCARVCVRNGWWNEYEPYIERGTFAYGAEFWKVARMLSGDSKPYRETLRGIGWLEDEGAGIIHYSEPYQILVRDPRLLRVVEKVYSGVDGKKVDRKIWRELEGVYGPSTGSKGIGGADVRFIGGGRGADWAIWWEGNKIRVTYGRREVSWDIDDEDMVGKVGRFMSSSKLADEVMRGLEEEFPGERVGNALRLGGRKDVRVEASDKGVVVRMYDGVRRTSLEVSSVGEALSFVREALTRV
jgi:hypothetical protein